MANITIPKFQTAAVVDHSGANIRIDHKHPVKSQEELQAGECLVKLDCSGRSRLFNLIVLLRAIEPNILFNFPGACHTDLHAALGDWPVPAMTPLIGGHEGVGIIVAIGNNTASSPVKIGDRVGIKWLADSSVFPLYLPVYLLTFFNMKGASTVNSARKAENRVSLPF